MRVVFLGTPEFAIPTLHALLESAHEVVLVVTRPPHLARGRKASMPTEVAQAASGFALHCISPRNVNDEESLNVIRDTAPDLLVTVAFGQLMETTILNMTRYGILNLHPSLLPCYRGASPIQSAIAAGDTQTGVTVLRTDKGWDSGPIYAAESVAIGPHDTAPMLSTKLAVVGSELLIRTLDHLDQMGFVPTPQNRALATMTSSLTREDADVDWDMPASVIYNRYRAYTPWPGTRTTIGNSYLKIIDCRKRSETIDGEPGTPAVVSGSLLVACGANCLEVRRLQPEGRNEMSAPEFLRGYRRLLNERWGPPPDCRE